MKLAGIEEIQERMSIDCISNGQASWVLKKVLRKLDFQDSIL